MIEIVLCESYSSLYLTLITFLENVYNTVDSRMAKFEQIKKRLL